jgi:hypothetical protein
MTNEENNIENLIEELELKERRWRRRTVLYTLFPVALLVMIVWYFQSQIKHANNEWELLKNRNDSLSNVILNKENYLNQRERKLQLFQYDFMKELSRGDMSKSEMKRLFDHYATEDSALKVWMNVARKVEDNKIYVHFGDTSKFNLHRPQSKRILPVLVNLQGIRWTTGGDLPERGFDANGLIKYSLSSVGATIKNSFTDPLKLDDGDIVDLKNGYSMFYFKLKDQPVFIGMTESGLFALKPTFGEVEKYRKVEY